ncbi:MAG: hypothetical protein M3680_18680, partial [Myxococcota bacterium]|nr:hypothetical protein [Myxococcota bacterium]
MATSYDDAVAELHQAPHASFIAERKRLAGERKVAGDPTGATKLAKLPRPPISAWTVNQLWWHARDAFDELFETAERLRSGELAATAAHREAIAKLRARATRILADAGHASTEATLRKVTTTLAALAATGGWDPDPPGALGADRDPPGFGAIGIGAAADAEVAEVVDDGADDGAVDSAGDELAQRRKTNAAKAKAKATADDADDTDDAKAAATKSRAAQAEERRRAEAEAKREQAEA